MMMTSKTDTFPRNCEMGNGAIRMGYSHIERAHDAAIVEQALRDGVITAARAADLTREVELHRYSFGPMEIML